MSDYNLLLPQPDETTQPFWDATKQGKLMLQRCADCKTFRHPPSPLCSNCYSEETEWAEISGKGTIYTHIEVYQPVIPVFRDVAPYNVVNVTPDDAPNVKIMGNVVDASGADLKCGMAVEVVFDDVAEDVAIPRWKLV